MSSPTASSIVDENLPPKDIIMVLMESINGNPPKNVLPDVNPFDFEPKYLPCGFWYLIKQNEVTNFGFWRVKGEACKLFSNTVITGWRTTFAYYEGQSPCENETDWVMHKYWITQNVPGESSKFKEAKSLCRVFRGRYPNYEKNLIMTCESHNHATQSSTFSVDDTNNGSARNIEVDHERDYLELDDLQTQVSPSWSPAEIRTLALMGRINERDYLELDDLQTLVSPPWSPDSIAVSMSSDECFDPDALLKDLESDSNRELKPKHDDQKFSVSASQRPDELVMFSASPESFVVEEICPPSANFRQTDLSSTTLAKKHTGSGGNVSRLTASNQNVKHIDEGPSRCREETCSSSSGHSGSQDGKGKDDAKGRKKRSKNKYLCFMPLF